MNVYERDSMHTPVMHMLICISFSCVVPQNKLAKALYDNTAECADELAFRKGDIIMVMDENVAGTSGWWMCSLYGRQGLAPANRLQLLSHACSTGGSSCHAPDKQEVHQDNSAQNIYQIPSVPQKSRSQQYDTYIPMDMIYNVPSAPLTALKSPAAPEHTTEVRVSDTCLVMLLFFLQKCSL